MCEGILMTEAVVVLESINPKMGLRRSMLGSVVEGIVCEEPAMDEHV